MTVLYLTGNDCISKEDYNLAKSAMYQMHSDIVIIDRLNDVPNHILSIKDCAVVRQNMIRMCDAVIVIGNSCDNEDVLYCKEIDKVFLTLDDFCSVIQICKEVILSLCDILKIR